MKPKTIPRTHLIAASLIALLLILFSCAGDDWLLSESGGLPPALEPVVEVFAPEGDRSAPSVRPGGPFDETESPTLEVGAHIRSATQFEDDRAPEGRDDVAARIGNPTPEASITTQSAGANGGSAPLPGTFLALSMNGQGENGSSPILDEVAAWLATWTPPGGLTDQPFSGSDPIATSPEGGALQGPRPPPLGGPLHGGSGPPAMLPGDDGLPGVDPDWPTGGETRAIPEPPLLVLLLLGLLSLAAIRGVDGWCGAAWVPQSDRDAATAADFNNKKKDTLA